MEAARGIVARVFRAIEFGGGNDFQRDVMFLRKSNCVREMSARQAGGISNDGKHVVAKKLVGRPSQERGINTPGIGDQRSTERMEAGVKGDTLGGQVCGHWHRHMVIRGGGSGAPSFCAGDGRRSLSGLSFDSFLAKIAVPDGAGCR